VNVEAPDEPPPVSTPVPDSSPPRQVWIPDPTPRQPRPQPGQNGVTLLPDGGGERVGTLPLPPLPGDDRPPGGGLDPYSVAIDILAHVPLPDITVRMSPAIGLVALPSWYWIEGYDGQPFGASRTIDIPPEVSAQVPFTEVPEDDPRRQGRTFTVEVRVWADRYDWSFGDGAGLTTRSLGRSYPDEADLKHTYEHSSLRYPDGFPVRVTAAYAAAWRVDGGEWQGLRTIRRTYGGSFRVQEIQTVLVGGR
jgi:hypothetical protein